MIAIAAAGGCGTWYRRGMAVAIFGHRYFGRVDGHQGEFAMTRFFHINYVPLVPMDSFWVTQDGATRGGHKIRLHGKSVVAAYLRILAPVVAVALLLAAPGVTTGVIAVALLGAMAWSWTWRGLRGDRARRRSDFHSIVYSSRCEPARYLADRRAVLRSALDSSWAERAAGRPPEDVARFGASDASEGVLAYGLLRLAALELRGAGAAEHHALADRILDGRIDPAVAGDGPYRDATTQAAATSAAVAAEAQRRAAARAPSRRTQLRSQPRVQLIGLIIVSTVAAAGATEAYRSQFPMTADAETLDVRPPLGRAIHVACTRDIIDPELQIVGEAGDDPEYILLCPVGDRSLVVISEAATVPTELSGKFFRATDEELWAGTVHSRVGELGPTYTVGYLDLTTKGQDRIVAMIVALMSAGVLVGWVLFLRRWWQRRRQAA